MNATQIQTLIFENSRDLPKEILEGILDFTQFLKIKRLGENISSVHTTLSVMNLKEEKHLGEEFMDYKTIYPRE